MLDPCIGVWGLRHTSWWGSSDLASSPFKPRRHFTWTVFTQVNALLLKGNKLSALTSFCLRLNAFGCQQGQAWAKQVEGGVNDLKVERKRNYHRNKIGKNVKDWWYPVWALLQGSWCLSCGLWGWKNWQSHVLVFWRASGTTDQQAKCARPSEPTNSVLRCCPKRNLHTSTQT